MASTSIIDKLTYLLYGFLLCLLGDLLGLGRLLDAQGDVLLDVSLLLGGNFGARHLDSKQKAKLNERKPPEFLSKILFFC